MRIKDAIQTPCGLRYMVDALDIQSGTARRTFLEQEMILTNGEIEQTYALLHQYVSIVRNPENNREIKNLQFRLQGLKDLQTTIHNLKAGKVLDDIELFEIKHLALLSGEIAKTTAKTGIPFSQQEMESVVQVLDPDGLNIATFYIYDSYSETLRTLRKAQEKNPQDEKLFIEIQDEEARIRETLCVQLRPLGNEIEQVLRDIVNIDITLAKALQIVQWGLCIPAIGAEMRLKGMWNPEVENHLRNKGKEYQKNDIRLTDCPTILTGSNMGGKTVVLKTVALCQYLTQFGMGIPAEEAHITLRDAVYCCMVDGQSVETGLSSFASEMKAINEVIDAARTSNNILALIDEPARTTNPTEGTAIVSALIEVLKKTKISVLIVTHYTIDAHACPCMRVRGLENGEMNYHLVEAKDGEVPHEALQVAEQLGIDSEWLRLSREQLVK